MQPEDIGQRGATRPNVCPNLSAFGPKENCSTSPRPFMKRELLSKIAGGLLTAQPGRCAAHLWIKKTISQVTKGD
ncbi:Hypothetical protein NTJ_14192 [Nesidiocoris tenuis]|uniref:Uncharacterized protein n=1 Tax=Nesidiocoris tenuis TaxID=355587 RepID=A0ABN7BAG1_9HEMI|nr:Hypothetical protein NTJ_14192 [Nesidiocoris tenuis]